MSTSAPDDPVAHCVARVVALAAIESPDRRDLLQLGYNLGRLSELTGAGRAPFWDAWKGPVSAWDRATLQSLAHRLQINHNPVPSNDPDVSTPPE
ncbi:hypothetical protein AB1L88_09630 [Tautonia sp. JC769]|uniref:hypothetical protein n=1 Tax=Tautonia sp. JC769 TaxID=3232135 RepID=UPI00345965FE